MLRRWPDADLLAAYGFSDELVGLLRNGVRVKTTRDVPHFHSGACRVREGMETSFSNELERLSTLGAAERVRVRPKVLNPSFEVDRSSAGRVRHVLDCTRSGLNASVDKIPVSYPDIGDIVGLAYPEAHLTVFDLRDGFFNLWVAPESRGYFGFRDHQGRYWRYCRLPFGFRNSPGYFSLVSSGIKEFAERCGLGCEVYVDDGTVVSRQGMGPQRAQELAETFLSTLHHLGFVLKVGVQIASTRVSVLGYVIDTVSGTLTLEVRKWTKLRLLLERYGATRDSSTLMSLCGYLVHLSAVWLDSRPRLRPLWTYLYEQEVAPDFFESLDWFRTRCNEGIPSRRLWVRSDGHFCLWRPSEMLFTQIDTRVGVFFSDASHTGWGGYYFHNCLERRLVDHWGTTQDCWSFLGGLPGTTHQLEGVARRS